MPYTFGVCDITYDNKNYGYFCLVYVSKISFETGDFSNFSIYIHNVGIHVPINDLAAQHTLGV